MAETDEELRQQGRFEELAARKDAENAALRAAWAARAVETAIRAEATAAETIDADAIVALVSRDWIKIDGAFNVTGAREAVQRFKQEHPCLFGAATRKGIPPPGTRDMTDRL